MMKFDARGFFGIHDRRLFMRSEATGTEYTYGQAGFIIGRLADAMRRQGVCRGDFVIAAQSSLEEAIFLHLACRLTGVVWVGIGSDLSEHYRRTLAQSLGGRVFLHADAPVAASAAPFRLLTFHDFFSATGPHIDEVIMSAKGEPIPPNAVSVLVATSGSTDEPKLVARSFESWEAAPDHFVRRFHLNERVGAFKVCQCIDLIHVAGLMSFYLCLQVQGSLLIPDRREPERLLAAIKRLDPDFMLAPARILRLLHAQYQDLLSHDPAARWLGRSTRYLITGGAKVPAAFLDILRKQGVDAADYYGSSEAGGIAATANPPDPDNFLRLMAGVSARLDADGELLVKTPSIMHGYLNLPGESASCFTPDRYFRTGDFATLRGQLVRIEGRKRQVFNTPDGSNVHPERIEAKFEALSWITQAVAVGDGKPFISMLLVVSDAGGAGDGSGYLDPAAFASLYQRAEDAMAAINTVLEAPEQVRRLCLFSRKMPDDLVRDLAIKRKVDRAGIASRYAGYIEMMYAGPLNEPKKAV